MKPSAVNQDWAKRLVQMWCRSQAEEMTPLIRRCRNAYKKGPIAPEAAKFVKILERHQADWLAQAERWMDDESDELAAARLRYIEGRGAMP